MNIFIRTIHEKEHRPGISGADWFFDRNGDLQVRVSKLSDWKREMCLAVHELFEALCCRNNGVSHHAVDEFDKQYDATHSSDLNAGDDPLCIYAREHTLATAVERILAAEYRIQWHDYDQELASIPSARNRVRPKARKGKSQGRPRTKDHKG